MTNIKDLPWETFETFLLIDRKLSDHSSALGALKSRFLVLQKYFTEVEFNRENFVQFVAGEKKRGISDSTINKYIGLVKNIARYLKVKDLEDFTYYREKTKKDIDCLTWEEMDTLANMTMEYRTSKEGLTSEQQNHRWYCYITLLSSVGCRQIEATNLLWEDLHPEYIIFRDTKNGEDRYVPIKPEFYTALQQLPKLSKKVFNMSDVSGNANVELKKRAKTAGISKAIYNHIFRHSVATNLMKDGEDVMTISKLLGWKDINTARRYEHLNLSDMTDMLYRSSRIWKKDQSIETVKNRIRAFISKTVDISQFQLQFKEEQGGFEIKVRQLPSSPDELSFSPDVSTSRH